MMKRRIAALLTVAALIGAACGGDDDGKKTLTVCVRTPGPRGGRRAETRTFSTMTRSLLVVTFDEGIRENNTVATIFAGPAARPGARSPRQYTHYSLLRTIVETGYPASRIIGRVESGPPRIRLDP